MYIGTTGVACAYGVVAAEVAAAVVVSLKTMTIFSFFYRPSMVDHGTIISLKDLTIFFIDQ